MRDPRNELEELAKLNHMLGGQISQTDINRLFHANGASPHAASSRDVSQTVADQKPRGAERFLSSGPALIEFPQHRRQRRAGNLRSALLTPFSAFFHILRELFEQLLKGPRR
jgi:hypothetical protein